jgi:hypothetical protein
LKDLIIMNNWILPELPPWLFIFRILWKQLRRDASDDLAIYIQRLKSDERNVIVDTRLHFSLPHSYQKLPEESFKSIFRFLLSYQEN